MRVGETVNEPVVRMKRNNPLGEKTIFRPNTPSSLSSKSSPLKGGF